MPRAGQLGDLLQVSTTGEFSVDFRNHDQPFPCFDALEQKRLE